MNKHKLLLTNDEMKLLESIVSIKPLDTNKKTIEVIEGGLKIGSKEYIFTKERE